MRRDQLASSCRRLPFSPCRHDLRELVPQHLQRGQARCQAPGDRHDLCAAGAAVASTAGNAVRNTLSDAWEAAQVSVQNFGVSGNAASFLVPILVQPVVQSIATASNFHRSFGPNQAYTLKTLSPTADIYGKNFSFVRGALGFSTLEFVASSPFSTGKLSFDKATMYGQFGASLANGGVGVAFELSGNIVSTSTEFNVLSIGGTTFSIASQTGFGGLLKGSLMVDNAKGFVIGGGIGLGRNASLELRFRRQKEP